MLWRFVFLLKWPETPHCSCEKDFEHVNTHTYIYVNIYILHDIGLQYRKT